MPTHKREHPSYIPSILKESFISITRYKLITTAASISIIAALLILGVFIVFTLNVNQLTTAAESNLQIRIFLKDDVDEGEKELLYETLEGDERISNIEFESKEEALENFSNSLSDYSDLLDSYTGSNNPLPESYIVNTYNTEDLAAIRDLANEYSNVVEYVRYQESYINSLTSFTNFINILSLALLIIMSVIALFLIYNMIRLTVENREQEIEIMKSLGATNSFIRTPFILEGTFIGILSAIISILFICMIYYYLVGYLSGSILFSINSFLVPPEQIVLSIVLSFLAYGSIIGSIGAAFAMNKYLNL